MMEYPLQFNVTFGAVMLKHVCPLTDTSCERLYTKFAVPIFAHARYAFDVYGCQSLGRPVPVKLPPTVVALNGRDVPCIAQLLPGGYTLISNTSHEAVPLGK